MWTNRPKSLSDAASVKADDFMVPLYEFLDEFYLAHPDKKTQSSMIALAPALVGDDFVDGYFAAVGEHLARRWELTIPDWVFEEGRAGPVKPAFVPDEKPLWPIYLVESPYAFRNRNIFTNQEPLRRARWPVEEPVIEPMGAVFSI
jgi:hypothetical protein